MTNEAEVKAAAWKVIAAKDAGDSGAISAAIEDMRRVLNGENLGYRRDNDPGDR